MSLDLSRPIGPEPDPEIDPRRLFVREPGWRVALKVGSEREFCYQIAPGQDHYHRLGDGEIYLYQGEERICLACAARRGLLAQDPRRLGQRAHPVAIEGRPDAPPYELKTTDEPADPTA